MHILAFEQQPTSFSGGQERSLFEVCGALAGAGAALSLAYQEPGDLLTGYREFCQGMLQQRSRQLQPRGAPQFARELVKLGWLGRRRGWDVLYVNQYFDLPFVIALGALLRVPVVCHLRMGAPHYLSRQYRFGLQRCAALIAISEHTKRDYASHGIDPDSMVVIHNAIDAGEDPAQSADGHACRILYLGRITPAKGIDDLVQAFALVAQTRPDAVLDLYGNFQNTTDDAAYERKVRNDIDRLALRGRVRIHPHTKNPKDVIQGARLLVLPSHWEAFGRVLLEAMSCGVPPIATDVGGIPEVFGDELSGHLVPVGDPRLLAEKMLSFLDWPDHTPHLGETVRRRAREGFCREKQTRNILHVFERVVEQHAAVRRPWRARA